MINKKSILQKAGLIVFSVLLSVFIAEVALRLVYPAETRYYVWQPNLQHTFYPDSNIFYGIKGEKHFTINSFGARGYGYPLTWLCIGGSTTECLYLDDAETWPALLQKQLGEDNSKTVASIGKSGTTTREHYIQLKYFAPQIKNLNGVILMVGFNDLIERLNRDTLFESDFRFTSVVEDSFVNTIFLKDGREHEKTWWRRTALFQLFRKYYHQSKPDGVKWEMQDDNGLTEKRWRENRQRASAIIDTLPDLTSALNEYERNLQLIYSEARHQKLEVIFINQASIYKDTMSAYENSILWMGGIGNFQSGVGHAYYSTKTLRKGLDLYNQKLSEFCVKNKIVMVDIDKALPRDTSVFYDDCHFNEQGAQKVATVISKAMVNSK